MRISHTVSADGVLSDRLAKGLVLTFCIAYAVHAILVVGSQRHLYGDSSFFLTMIISEGRVHEWHTDWRELYTSRFFALILTQLPAVFALSVQQLASPERLSYILGATYVGWKLLSVLISYWILPRGDKRFVIFPIAAILAGTINSEIYLASEAHIAAAIFWPLIIAVAWLPVNITWIRTICVLCAIVVASFLYEIMAALLLAPLALVIMQLFGNRRNS